MTADDVTLTHPIPEGSNVVQRIVNAWDCCGTCAGGVLAAHVRATVAAVQAERDVARTVARDNARQYDLCVDRAESAERRLAEVEAQFGGAREDIRARKREFARLGADREYLNALDDSFGIVSNRIRAALADPPALAQHDAEVGARALREAASDIVADCSNQPGPCICVARDWLRGRADALTSEGGQP